MAEQQNQSAETAKEDLEVLKKRPSGADASADASPLKFKKMLVAVNSFLDSLDVEEPEPPPPPEKPLKESIQDFIECCRDPEKRIAMLKAFSKCCRTMLFWGTLFCILFVLTVWVTSLALEFNENHRIKFYPPDEVVDYLISEHETLEAMACKMMPLSGKDDNISLGRFDAKFIETVKPIRIYSDEYGVYFMTSKGWYNGEHGIFIAKDEEKNMPPNINWGLIEGRIYTYVIFD